VQAAIEQELRQEAGRAKAASEAASALEAITAGRPLEQVVTEKKVDLKAPGLIRRGAPGVDAKLVEAVFRLPRPAPGQASRELVTLPNGDVAVVVATAVQDADWGTASDDERRGHVTRLRESQAGAEFAAYRADLQQRLEVKIVNPPETEPEPAS